MDKDLDMNKKNFQEEDFDDCLSTPFDDDNYSSDGDSGFSMSQEDDEDECKGQRQDEALGRSITVADTTSSINFFSRIASIPIIQDSYKGAQKIAKQHAIGQRALNFAEDKLQTVISSTQPYLDNDKSKKILSYANTMGNKSLDLFERQFPGVITTPTDQLLVQPIRGAVSSLQEKKKTIIDSRIDYMAGELEALINQYIPLDNHSVPPEEDTDSEVISGTDRLMKVIHAISIRAAKRISSAKREERQVSQIIHTWILTQIQMISQQQQQQQQWPLLQAQIESFLKTKLVFTSTVQAVYEFTQTELEKFRQELYKPNIGHMDRIRNILTLSQNDIWVPLYQRSFSIWKKNDSIESVIGK
ncbi:uncharacterized protein BX663DRAFT_515150 [Cokeromyces recurvatus]|uniref:uncharacterized protein n=1 Tax=Cokeromyces recurvatus TaxID=90255 RepID=UPI0022208E41|nr:uncharacterized protein BX663DRAFT_515150 [Cokeromyces recurvatus]KAI7901162.1 hypothetical protein BX663DRAFT_515150 [Cokeromyces recurvatus]